MAKAKPAAQKTNTKTKTTSTKKSRTTPDGYHSITPCLIVRGGARALEFYKKAFGATELFHLDMKDGRLGHAEFKIGDSIVMLADEFPEMECRSPQAYGGTPVSLMVYVEDVDAQVARAVAAGAKLIRPVKDQFYGARSGVVLDPFGHQWTLATHKEDLTPQELAKRMESMQS